MENKFKYTDYSKKRKNSHAQKNVCEIIREVGEVFVFDKGDWPMEIKNKDLHILLNHFYNYYFVDYLEEILVDEKDEFSTVILIEGIEYFLGFCKENDIKLPFKDLKDYLEQNYIDWEEIHAIIMKKYKKELNEYGENFNLTFEECNNYIEF